MLKRVDETYVRVKGRWCYSYRAIDSKGATIDFLLSAFRDADAAKRQNRHAERDPTTPPTLPPAKTPDRSQTTTTQTSVGGNNRADCL
jgi:transposase-like protein